MFFIKRGSDINSISPDGRIVLYKNTIMNYCDAGRLNYIAFLAESRRGKNNIIGLPFAGRLTRIYEWWTLLIGAGRLSIHIGFIYVVIIIKHLHFVTTH